MSEESQLQQEVRAFVDLARCSLPPESGSRAPVPAERAILALADAVERIVEGHRPSSPLPTLFRNTEFPRITIDDTLDEYSSGQREALDTYANIPGYEPPQPGRPRERKFRISFPDIELTEKEVWPEGDAPEDPTPEDVVQVMRDYSTFSHPISVAADWLLIESLSVSCWRPDGSMEGSQRTVEWDGS